MGAESSLVWSPLESNMPGVWERIENRVKRGMPDCVYLMQGKTGWVELKYLPAWPARDTTQTTLGLKPLQAHWQNRWAAHKGRCHLLARVGGARGGWLLVPGSRVVRKDTEAGWRLRAQFWWGVINFEQLTQQLLLDPPLLH